MSALRLKLTTKARDGTAPPKQDSPATASPSIKLKLKAPSKPAPSTAEAGKKREHDGNEASAKKETPSVNKKLKLSMKGVHRATGEPQSATITTPFVRFKIKEKEKLRLKAKAKEKEKALSKGYSYDSEASDKEKDPVEQFNFILRMPPGDDSEWVKSMIEKRELHINKKSFKLRFLQEDGRRAMLTIRGRSYAAILVDLPCIIESMKGWDKKGWYKSADIHQMLLVMGTVMSETEAMNYPIPKGEVNEKTWAYAHGLTPPMHWVRKRRFRKRISTHAIQDIETSVKRLLEKDAEAEGDVRFEVLDKEALRRQEDAEAGYSEDEDGEGDFEDSYYEEDLEPEEEPDEDIAAQFESFLGGGEDVPSTPSVAEAVATPASSSVAALDTRNATDSEANTPAAVEAPVSSDDDDDEEDDESDSEREERAGFQRAREEIDELESAIKEQHAELERVANPLLKARIRTKIQSLQADLELKKSAIGDEDDD